MIAVVGGRGRGWGCSWASLSIANLSQTFFKNFFKVFGGHTCPFLGPLVPLFWISGDVSSGVQSQSRICLIRFFCEGECYVHSPRSTSGATLADLLVAGREAGLVPTYCCRGEVAGIRTRALRISMSQTLYQSYLVTRVKGHIFVLKTYYVFRIKCLSLC